jgi:holin-like protein
MLGGLSMLLSFQLIGEILHRWCAIPLPGAVIGMFLLALFLFCKPKALTKSLESTSSTLFGWLGLLFVPAGTGAIANIDLIGAQWFPIVVALIGSTILSLLTTGIIMHRFSPEAESENVTEAFAVTIPE